MSSHPLRWAVALTTLLVSLGAGQYVFWSLRSDVRYAVEAQARFVAKRRLRSLRFFFFGLCCANVWGVAVLLATTAITWKTLLGFGGVLGMIAFTAVGFIVSTVSDQEFRALFRGVRPYCGYPACSTCHPPLRAEGTEQVSEKE